MGEDSWHGEGHHVVSTLFLVKEWAIRFNNEVFGNAFCRKRHVEAASVVSNTNWNLLLF